MKVTKTTKQIIAVEGKSCMEQNPDGTWDISVVSVYSMTLDAMRRLHAALGEVLTDAAQTQPLGAVANAEVPF